MTATRSVPRILPRLAYQRPAEAVAWLERAFGFREDRGERISAGEFLLTELELGPCRIMVGSAGQHELESPKKTGALNQMLIVYVSDVDAHFARARDAGADVISEPEDQFWGDRRYEAHDCEGHRWAFHQKVRDVPRDEWDWPGKDEDEA